MTKKEKPKIETKIEETRMWDLLYKVLGSTYRAGFTEGFNFHDEKEFEISHGSKGRSYESVENEIKKCVLLCANCHAELHMEE